jgi:hypothetical protein
MSEEMPETASDVAWSARLLTMRLQGLTDFRFPFLRQLAPVLPVSVLPVCTDNLNAGVAVMKSAQDGA